MKPTGSYLIAHRRAARRRYVPHTPWPKQAAFLALNCKEGLYGGAARGGKTDALLMGALRYVHVPGYAALLLRRTYPELTGADGLKSRADEWLYGSDAKWLEREHCWKFPSGARVEFGHCQHDKDKYKYQGNMYQFIGFDQLDQFLLSQYTYLHTRLNRLQGSTIPTIMRASANPGGIGHEWIAARFSIPTDPGDDIIWSVNKDGEPVAFLPARLEDNPSVDQKDYDRNLRSADAITYEQLRWGKWIRDTTGLVYRYSHTLNRIDAAPDKKWRLVIGVDFGVTNACAFTVLAWDPEDETLYVLRSYRKEDCDPEDAAQEVFKLTDEFGQPEKIVGDEGGLGKGFAEYMRRRYTIPVEPAEKTNKLGFQKLLNADLERGRLKLVGDQCGDLIDELGSLCKAEGEENEGAHTSQPNHCCDSLLYGWRASRHWQVKAKPEPPKVPTAAETERRMEAEREAKLRRRARPWWR